MDLAFRQPPAQLGVKRHAIRGLPKNFRGRCKPAVFHKTPVQSLAPNTRPGDYQPPGEIYDFATRKKVIYLRRVQSFLRRFQKHHHTQNQFASELLQEWDAILRDKSRGMSFRLWCQQQPELGPPRYPLLSFDYVHSV